MNTVSRTITGIIAMVIGIGVTITGLFSYPAAVIYGIMILVIGIIIFFNKKEDEIEQIKTKTKKGGR